MEINSKNIILSLNSISNVETVISATHTGVQIDLYDIRTYAKIESALGSDIDEALIHIVCKLINSSRIIKGLLQ